LKPKRESERHSENQSRIRGGVEREEEAACKHAIAFDEHEAAKRRKTYGDLWKWVLEFEGTGGTT
jgi:hypothetical protein